MRGAHPVIETAVIMVFLGAASATRAAPAPRPEPVPHEQASYRSIAFENKIATILWMDLPPGKSSDYHVHTKDMTCVVLDDYPPEAHTQRLGEAPGSPRKPKRGEVSYVTYFGKPSVTHRDINPGTLSMHQICIQLRTPVPLGFSPEARIGPGYTQELDNHRVRAWRLVLNPGETAAAIDQKAPGIRVVIDGGEIDEVTSDKRERNIVLRPDHFYWQDPGVTRVVRNMGATRIQLVEYEFK